MSGKQAGEHDAARRALASALIEHREELVLDLTRADRAKRQWDWLDLAPAADMLLEALGIERLGLMGSNPTTIDSLAWGHRYNIGDRVVRVSDRHLYDRDVPLFRIRAVETSGSSVPPSS